jgi:hypothetical protein
MNNIRTFIKKNYETSGNIEIVGLKLDDVKRGFKRN